MKIKDKNFSDLWKKKKVSEPLIIRDLDLGSGSNPNSTNFGMSSGIIQLQKNKSFIQKIIDRDYLVEKGSKNKTEFSEYVYQSKRQYKKARRCA